eukprot:471400-Hanusia_phi.AAC.1
MSSMYKCIRTAPTPEHVWYRRRSTSGATWSFSRMRTGNFAPTTRFAEFMLIACSDPSHPFLPTIAGAPGSDPPSGQPEDHRVHPRSSTRGASPPRLGMLTTTDYFFFLTLSSSAKGAFNRCAITT